MISNTKLRQEKSQKLTFAHKGGSGGGSIAHAILEQPLTQWLKPYRFAYKIEARKTENIVNNVGAFSSRASLHKKQEELKEDMS